MPQNLSGARIHLESVSHHYRESGAILNSLSFDIQSGEFLSILGPSGCGKSTLLRLLSDLEQPSGGKLDFFSNRRETVRGIVFQEPRLLPWRTVLKNVVLPLELNTLGLDLSAQEEKAILALKRVGLEDALHKYPAQLSGGMKMRVSVARALVFQPNLLLLDEPFSALDEFTRQSLQEDLRQLWSSTQMTIVFITHSISEAVFLSNRALVLSRRPAHILLDQSIDLPNDRPSEIRLDPRFTAEMKKLSKYLNLKEESGV